MRGSAAALSKGMSDAEEALENEPKLSIAWLVVALGLAAGTLMHLSCVAALVRDFSRPDIGWGVLGLVVLQAPALAFVVLGACGVVAWRPQPTRRTTVALVLALAYVMLPFLALTWRNSGC